MKTIERQVGWGSVRSAEVVIVLLGAGFGLLLLGALPEGSIESLKAGPAEVRFSRQVFEGVVGAAAEAEVPSDRLPQVVSETLDLLGPRPAQSLYASRDEIDETIARVLEQEDEI